MQRAQMAAAPLTKTVPRQYIALFLDPPFMKFGLSILMKKGDKSSAIGNMADLSNQEEITYGLVGGGSTANFWGTARRDEYYKMWRKMDHNREASFLASVEDGVERVRQSTDSEPFAFIGEQRMIEYHASREPCDLVAVPGSVDEYTGEYHLAVSKNLDQETTEKLASALSNLKESGRLDELYNKWWTQRDQCSEEASSARVTSATFAMFALVPVVVAILFRVSGE